MEKFFFLGGGRLSLGERTLVRSRLKWAGHVERKGVLRAEDRVRRGRPRLRWE